MSHSHSAVSYRDPAIKWLALGQVLFAIVVALVGIEMINFQSQRHSDAVAAREHQNSSIRQLACIFVSQVPDNPKKPLIAQFRAAYHCPPFSKARAKNPFAPLPPVPRGTALPKSTASTSGITSTIGGTTVHVTPRGQLTVVKTTPRSTPTPKPSLTRTKPLPSPRSSGVTVIRVPGVTACVTILQQRICPVG